MPINTDFYGSENDWITLSSGTPDLYKTAYTYDNNANYQGSLKAFQDSVITNPDNVASPILDDSIIPWKINEKSDVFNQKYIYPYCSDFTTIQNSTWQYQISDYTQNVNGGFRFFLQDAYYTNNNNGANGVWSYRYSPLNTKAELDDVQYKYLFPIVGFDYSKCYIQISLLYVAKSIFDDTSTNWTATSVNTMYLKDIIDDDTKWQNNYFYGIQYELRYKGLSGSHSLGLFAYDKIKASPYSGGYYPYGSDFNHYQTAMTNVHDTGQMGRAQIGGAVGGTGNGFAIRWDNTIHTDIVELFKKNYDETNCLRHMGGLNDGENIVFHRQSGANTVRLIPFRTYDSDSKQNFIDYVRQQAAYLGFPFSDYSYNMIDDPDKTYIPEINASGVTTGNYALANTQPEYINAEWTNDVYDKTPYNPENDKADDPNTYDDNTTILNTDTQIPSYFTIPYVMNTTKVIATAEKFYDKIDTDFTSDLWSAKTLYTNNPIDAVISLMYFPFHLSHGAVRPQLILTQQQHLVFGAVDLESVADAVLSSSCVLDFGKCTYFPNFGVDDFRNYEPYCKGELYIPYCGSVAINPSEFLNRTISVKMIVDLRNGSCLALVFRDNLVVETASGQIGIAIPVSGLQSQTLASAEIQAKTSYQNSKSKQLSNIAKTAIDLVGNSMSGNVFGMLNSIANQSQIAIGENNLYKSKFELEHIQIPFSVKGSASSATALINEQRCRFILYRPIMLENDLTTFAHQNGYATLEHNTLNNYTGFTMCDTADLSGIDCTKSEKNLIMNHLRNGVYL